MNTENRGRFWPLPLSERNIEDLNQWVNDDALTGIVDEDAGGIVGYLNETHVDTVLDLLNQTEAKSDEVRFVMEMEKESLSSPANREAVANRLHAIADKIMEGYTAGETQGAVWDLAQ